MAVAIEDAGFEIRDQIMWVYGSGFPKSMNIAKAIEATLTTGNSNKTQFKKLRGEKTKRRDANGLYSANEFHDNRPADYTESADGDFLTNLDPTTPEAKQWQGWGTALKPAHEPIVLARKPLIGTVAKNVLAYGTGALNIDATRVTIAEGDEPSAGSRTATFGTQETISGGDGSGGWQPSSGRFPANFIHDGSDEVVALFPTTTSGKPAGMKNIGSGYHGNFGSIEVTGFGDTGSAARFFYCAKASKRDRNEGLDGFEAKQTLGGGGLTAEIKEDGSYDTASAGGKYGSVKAVSQNYHPTVKPTALMQYLVRLVTPPNGTVLDPFLGSGSTGKACMYEKFNFIGIEMTEEYLPIARARIEFAQQDKELEQDTLF
jgi:site-specific DNA-methyltransferase (adenine-specific)